MIDKINNPLDTADKTPRILKVDGTEVPFPPANGKTYTLEEMQKAISGDGNNDPCITIAGRMDGMMMIAEDNGIAMRLKPNEKGTFFYCKACRIPREAHTIVGNCLVFPEEMME